MDRAGLSHARIAQQRRRWDGRVSRGQLGRHPACVRNCRRGQPAEGDGSQKHADHQTPLCMTTSFTAPRCGVALPKSPTRLRLHARHALQAGGYTPPMVFAQPCGALKGACAQRCSTEIRPRPPAKAQQTDMGSPPWRAERSSLKRDRSQAKQPEPPPLRSQVDPGASDLRRTR